MQHELGPFTIADWHALATREDVTRLELIEGYWLATPPPSGQHQWAEKCLIRALDTAINSASRTDLYAVDGVGVELSTNYRTAVIPDLVVLDTVPTGNSFEARNVLLAGEIWSPGNTLCEQRDKFDACADADIPFFWSIAQDRRGSVELTAGPWPVRAGGHREARRGRDGDHREPGPGRGGVGPPAPLTCCPVVRPSFPRTRAAR